MDAQFALSSLFPIALVARLFRLRRSRYHKVDAVVRVAVVVRIAAVVDRLVPVVARLIALAARFVSLRVSFFPC